MSLEMWDSELIQASNHKCFSTRVEVRLNVIRRGWWIFETIRFTADVDQSLDERREKREREREIQDADKNSGEKKTQQDRKM